MTEQDHLTRMREVVELSSLAGWQRAMALIADEAGWVDAMEAVTADGTRLRKMPEDRREIARHSLHSAVATAFGLRTYFEALVLIGNCGGDGDTPWTHGEAVEQLRACIAYAEGK